MNSQLHLSEAQLYEELDHPDGLAAREHLASCAHCRAEVDAIRASLTSLRMASTSLAETGFRPRLEIRQPALWPGFWAALSSGMRTWPLSLAAAILLCAASLTLVHRPATTGSAGPAKPQAVVQPLTADTDDALLDGIDRDLSTSVAPSLAPLDISTTEGAESAARLN